MSQRPAALAALVLLSLAAPALAQEAPEAEAATCAARSSRKESGLGAFLSAANRAGVGDLLSGRSGQFLGSGKRSAIAGAVLGSALSAADPNAAASPSMGAPPAMFGVGGDHTAQIAAAATSTVIGLAQSAAAAQPTCPAK